MKLDQFFKSKGYGIEDKLTMEPYIDEFREYHPKIDEIKKNR